MDKTKKIVLDADVLIHFFKGECLSILPNIFPNNKFIILKPVYEETITKDLRIAINNISSLLKTLTIVDFSPTGEVLKEYACLRTKFGKGESACMAYCKFTRDVVGSSNLRDIRDYCEQNGIEYLTSLDFFWNAWQKGLMERDVINEALKEIVKKGSKIAVKDITDYQGRSF